MSKLTDLTDRPLKRRLPGKDLVVEIDQVGLRLRRIGGRRSHRLAWTQLFALADKHREPITHAAEKAQGRAHAAKHFGIKDLP